MMYSAWPALLSFSLLLTGACMVGEEGLDDDETLTIEGRKRASIRIIQHNIEKKPEALQTALEEAAAINAHGLTLEEVCPWQVEALRAQKQGKWTISSVDLGKAPNIKCAGADGLAAHPQIVSIWTGGPSGVTSRYEDLATPASLPGAMACVKFERGGVPVHLCAVHLIAGDFTDPATQIVHDGETARIEETTSIKRITSEWLTGAKNHFVILGGDFNSQPGQPPMDKLYDPALGGSGFFTEYNRSGGGRGGMDTAHSDGDPAEGIAPFSRKIDYILFSTNRAPLDGPPVDITGDASDHDMVSSTVSMKK